MSPVNETELPGVGTRFAFESDDGRTLGVIHHHDGRREVFVMDHDDPDCVMVSVSLEEGEAHLLADLLGGIAVTREVATLAHGVAGLTVDWVRIPEGPTSGVTIGHLQVRTRSGASIVAVLRGDDAHAAPGPEFVLEEDDVVLVVGTAAGARSARSLLRGEGDRS
jgi:TrkA domain protein